ncbi:hypothetical protein IX308_000777 [Porphyromonas levii]|uniref:hypothetical protein n=1 Tax=Porphyromonas levii TaxID=28114 RepID=UPI001BA7D60F|nr:hypothetical protein [Porphyromonas levii]MBR8784602.1 hypothetical protein [Porphyromonas levii]
MSWIIWVAIIFFIFKKGSDGLKKIIEEHQERERDDMEEAAEHNAKRDAQLEAWREEAHMKLNNTLPTPKEITPTTNYQSLDVLTEIEGGKLMVEVLDSKEAGKSNPLAKDILDLDSNIQQKLRTAVVMKEILDRKYN